MRFKLRRPAYVLCLPPNCLPCCPRALWTRATHVVYVYMHSQAAVQLVLSHVDRLGPIQAQLAEGDRDLEELLEAEPGALAAAAAPQLAWLHAQLQAHAERAKALGAGRGKPPALLRVQEAIPCVCASDGGDASLLALRDYLHKLLTATPPLLPSIGYQLPNSWAPALALPGALRDGRSPSTVLPTAAAPASADAAAAAATAPAAGAAKRPYVLLSELQALWRDEIAPRAVPSEPEPASILADTLVLLCNQGERHPPSHLT